MVGRQAHRSGKVVAHDLDLGARDVKRRIAGGGCQRQHDASGDRANHSLGGEVSPMDEPFAGPLAVRACGLALCGGFASRGLAPLLCSLWPRHAARRVGRHRTQATPAERALVLELATSRIDYRA